MKSSKSYIVLGLVSGSLLTLGFALLLFYAVLLLFLHHMFVIGVRSPAALLLFSTPILLIAVGSILLRRARVEATIPSSLRFYVGLLTALMPALLVSFLPLCAIAMGSLGMDIHFTPPIYRGYAIVFCLLLAVYVTFVVGLRLMRVRPI